LYARPAAKHTLHGAVQVLVGFADKLRLMNVLMDDVKVIKEVRGCVTGAQNLPAGLVLAHVSSDQQLQLCVMFEDCSLQLAWWLP
jgi:hypothetical protein